MPPAKNNGEKAGSCLKRSPVKLFPILVLLAWVAPVRAQYFQQHVDYRLAVRLDDRQHQLRGELELDYHNRSPQTLDTLWMHLWANAYSDRGTAFDRQKLALEGSTRFHFARPSERGGYLELAFSVDGKPAEWGYHPEHPDIAWVRLPQPLLPGASCTLHTPFTLQIPNSFSRLGRVGESYQLTQWYPKPAVYDADGWHVMPYLDAGEFYSEFGSFEVRITLPANYLVAATGELQEEAERAFLQEKALETWHYFVEQDGDLTDGFAYEPHPPSPDSIKTLIFRAERVHDFAWFADKRFKLVQDSVRLPSGRMVQTRVFFTRTEESLWEKAIEYVNRSVDYLSRTVGEYPWPHATAVQSALSAGAGMEYPMITVIGLSGDARSLDEVIEHEVGHNWFYGILATNERDHPWMDEGINTYYEQRYMDSLYGTSALDLPSLLGGAPGLDLGELGYLYQARQGLDQSTGLPSQDLNLVNYYLNAYDRPGKAFAYLEAVLGREAFDAAMQAYYRQWSFRHPGPADLQAVLEKETGRDLDWLFDQILNSDRKMDYALQKAKPQGKGTRLYLRNRGRIAGPVLLSGWQEDRITYSAVLPGFSGRATHDLPLPPQSFDRFQLDPHRLSPEVNRKNDQVRTLVLFPRLEPLQLSILPRLENDRHTRLFLTPALGWNNYDKTMLGAAVYSSFFPPSRFQFALVPLYAFGSRSLAGMGEVAWRMFPRANAIRQIEISAQGRLFHYDDNGALGYRLKYGRLVPKLRLDLGRANNRPFSHALEARAILLWKQEPLFSDEEAYSGLTWNADQIFELAYEGQNGHVLRPFEFRAALEHQTYELEGQKRYTKLSLEWRQGWMYLRDRYLRVRWFGGFFLDNTQRKVDAISLGAFNLAQRGPTDYRFDHLWLGRTDERGLWSQQVARMDGGLRLPLPAGRREGRSNSFILAFNLQADLPWPRGWGFFNAVKPYFDIGYYDDTSVLLAQNNDFADQLLWSGGLMLDVANGLFSVHFPLVNSANVRPILDERGNYWDRVTFTLDLARLRPREVIKELIP